MKTKEQIRQELDFINELMADNNQLIEKAKKYINHPANYDNHRTFIADLQQQNCKWKAVTEILEWVLS